VQDCAAATENMLLAAHAGAWRGVAGRLPARRTDESDRRIYKSAGAGSAVLRDIGGMAGGEGRTGEEVWEKKVHWNGGKGGFFVWQVR